MTLGYCKVCKRLLPITAREYKHPDSRERNWYPVEHDGDDGKPCHGDKKAL